MKKVLLNNRGMNRMLLVVLFIPFVVFAQNTTPSPENTPAGFADKSGPAPPPPTPIDNQLIWLLIASFLLAFWIIQIQKKHSIHNKK